MTEALFRGDAYVKIADGAVTKVTDEGGIVLDKTIFYPTGGGQMGDAGWLTTGRLRVVIATTFKGLGDDIVLVPEAGQDLPEVGTAVTQYVDWDRRYNMMRMHTALHLLSVVIPLPVTGGQISPEKGRLDFRMPAPPDDKDALEAELNGLIKKDFPVTEQWITDAELAAKPELVKTMSVQPPTGAGKVRLVRIGDETSLVDLQPCGGTHVWRTGEIGAVRIGKIENKGRENRRVNLFLEG